MDFPTLMFLILFLLLIIVVTAFVITLLLCLKFRAVKLALSRPPTSTESFHSGTLFVK